MARYQLMTFIIILSQSNLITQVPICMGGGGGHIFNEIRTRLNIN